MSSLKKEGKDFVRAMAKAAMAHQPQSNAKRKRDAADNGDAGSKTARKAGAADAANQSAAASEAAANRTPFKERGAGDEVGEFLMTRSIRDALEAMRHRGEGVHIKALMRSVTYAEHEKHLPELQAALRRNPKLFVDRHNMVFYRPTYNVRNADELLELLKRFHREALGAINYEELLESYPNVERDVERLLREDKIFLIKPEGKPGEKKEKQSIFFKDHEFDIEIDDEFKALWREQSMDTVTHRDIEKYLTDHKIGMVRTEFEKAGKKKRKGRTVNRDPSKMTNSHMFQDEPGAGAGAGAAAAK